MTLLLIIGVLLGAVIWFARDSGAKGAASRINREHDKEKIDALREAARHDAIVRRGRVHAERMRQRLSDAIRQNRDT